MPKKDKKTVKITKKSVRKDFSGDQYGPWKILSYVHHYGTSPIWEAECIYCGKVWETSLPKLKRTRECECEETLKWTSGIYIPNSIYLEYVNQAKKESESFSLTYIDLYKIYNRQNGVDKDQKPLIFDFHWNYHVNPPTCNYIWPDLERNKKSIGYNLNNCYFVSNDEQRYKRKRSNQIKRRNGV